MSKSLALVVATALLTALGAFSASALAGDPPVEAAKTRTVEVVDYSFNRATIKVRKGTIVKWVWAPAAGQTETDDHDVYSTKGTRLRSGFKKTGSYRKRIKRTTTYICRLHPYMRGKIKVVRR